MKPQLVCGTSLSIILTSAAFGQVNFSGNYSQNFDGLAQSGTSTLVGPGPHLLSAGLPGSTGVEGWYGANFTGSSTSTEFRAQDGSLAGSTGRGVVSFGVTGSSDRALGALATSNQIPSFGIVLINNTSTTYASLDVSYIGEQWRAGDANILDVLSFKYGFGSSLTNATTSLSSLDFASPNLAGGNIALDGNNASNQGSVHELINGLNWAPGQSLVLCWDAVDLSGQDNGLSIDNLVLTGIPVPGPGALALLAAAGAVGGRRRRRTV